MHQLVCKGAKTFGISFSKSVLNVNVLLLGITELPQALLKSLINSRRLMGSPQAENCSLTHCERGLCSTANAARKVTLWVISVVSGVRADVRYYPQSDRDSGVRPLGWTVSCGGFDSLPGVVILELCRAQIAERGV